MASCQVIGGGGIMNESHYLVRFDRFSRLISKIVASNSQDSGGKGIRVRISLVDFYLSPIRTAF